VRDEEVQPGESQKGKGGGTLFPRVFPAAYILAHTKGGVGGEAWTGKGRKEHYGKPQGKQGGGKKNLNSFHPKEELTWSGTQTKNRPSYRGGRAAGAGKSPTSLSVGGA